MQEKKILQKFLCVCVRERERERERNNLSMMENYAKNGRENNKFIGDYVDANAAQREHSNIKRYTLAFSNI